MMKTPAAAAPAAAAQEPGPGTEPAPIMTGPVESTEEAEESVSEIDDDPMGVTFWAPGPGTKVTRIHVQSLLDHTVMACGNVTVQQCIPMSEVPAAQGVCKNCVKARPEAILFTLDGES